MPGTLRNISSVQWFIGFGKLTGQLSSNKQSRRARAKVPNPETGEGPEKMKGNNGTWQSGKHREASNWKETRHRRNRSGRGENIQNKTGNKMPKMLMRNNQKRSETQNQTLSDSKAPESWHNDTSDVHPAVHFLRLIHLRVAAALSGEGTLGSWLHEEMWASVCGDGCETYCLACAVSLF